MLTWKNLLAGCGAVLALYIAVVLFSEVRYFIKGIATGPAVPAPAKVVLMYPAFWLAAVAVFLAAAFWARK